MRKKSVCCGLLGIGVLMFIILQVIQIPASEEYNSPEEVSIFGYSSNAMEPFISNDGQFLFFNSLNDGVNTSLLFAEKINLTTFQYRGEILGVNTATPHLDAVPSMDNNGIFYFISTRNYSQSFANVYAGSFQNGTVTNVHPVLGDFYIEEAGWLVMDAEISRDGNTLYIVNAKFTGGAMPTESKIRIAHKSGTGNETRFLLDSNSDGVLNSVNSKDLNYAPSTTADGLIMGFTRAAGITTQILITKRTNSTAAFGELKRIPVDGIVEAPTFSPDGNIFYFHKKVGDTYKLFLINHK